MIHATAIVDPGAKIGANVEIGPYSIIGPNVEIGDNTIIGPHVVIKGHTRIGRDNHIFQFCSLGEVPQDKKYAGEPTRLEIGDRNTIREFCTFNLGTIQDTGATRIGDDNWIMAAVGTVVLQEVPPYLMAAGNTAQPYGINVEGLKRRGFTAESLSALKRAYRTLYKSGNLLEEAKVKLAEEAKTQPDVQRFVDFLAVSKRGIIR